MGSLVLDSSVLIALLTAADPHHEAARAALTEAPESDVLIPAVAYAEAMVGPFRAGGSELRKAEQFFATLPGRIEPVSAVIARTAARLRAATPALRLPDALILATGEELRAEAILTADARWTEISKRVRVVRRAG